MFPPSQFVECSLCCGLCMRVVELVPDWGPTVATDPQTNKLIIILICWEEPEVYFCILCYSFTLTHLPLNKMATILTENIFRCIFSNKNDRSFDWNFTEICSPVFKIRSETCWTEAQFFQNLYMIKKESLPDQPKFCSGSAVRHSFWRLVPWCPIGSFGSGNGLVPNRWQAIIWTNAGLIHWRIYGAPGGDELKQRRLLVFTPQGKQEYTFQFLPADN